MTGLPGLLGIDHVGLTIPDLDAAVAFYCDVLGAVELYGLGPFDAADLPLAEDGRDWTEAHLGVADARLSFRAVRIGTTIIELFRYERPRDVRTDAPRGCDIGAHHLGIRVADVDAAMRYLHNHGVTVLDGPIVIPDDAASGPMRSAYFLDPWGNQLELSEHPD